MYADDTVIYGTDSQQLQRKLNSVVEWCSKNILTLNISKTKWMTIGLVRHIREHELRFKVKDMILEEVLTYKYLGVELDESLSYKHHRRTMVNHVQQKLSYFPKIRTFINTSVALTIYKSTILPIIEYADFIYDQTVEYVSKQIQSLQNRGLKIVFNQHNKRYDQRMPTTEMHREANLFRLKYRREQHLLTYAISLKQNPMLVDNRHIPTRRHTGIRLTTPKIKNYRFQKSIQYKAILAWNNLDNELTRFEEIKVFKKALKRSYSDPYS